ncbi:MAG: nucleotide exchange factor GrpE [bacterium]|nr:nucleotide exchange factor GrpE [bacterium]
MNKNNNNHQDETPLDKGENNEYDDVIFDKEIDDEVGETLSRDAMKKLRQKLEVCVKEKQEYLLGWQRSKADFVNARKSDEESRNNFIKFANEGLIEELLPVIESFEMAFGNKEAWEKVDKNWRTGVEYIHSKLMGTLIQHGLKELNPVGEKFDPTHHASFENVPTDNPEEDHIIVAVVQKGYALNGKIIKPPNVKVAVFEEKL